jgi:hypothetical protein
LDILQCDCPYRLKLKWIIFSVLIHNYVTPSQAISETLHSPWAAIGVDGCVIYAYCTISKYGNAWWNLWK